MKRREFIALLIGTTTGPHLTAVSAAAQQPAKVPRVGVLTPAQTQATAIFDGFRRGLRDLGYVDGTTILLDFKLAKGNLDALPRLANELVSASVDVILTDGNNAARAALDATQTIPIVMGVAADALKRTASSATTHFPRTAACVTRRAISLSSSSHFRLGANS